MLQHYYCFYRLPSVLYVLHVLHVVCAIIFIAINAVGSTAHAQFDLKNTTHIVTTPHVRAELIAHAPEGILPGQAVWLGLRITHQKDWHTYWKNPGDSGLPTELQWQLPVGLEAGEIAWPVPHPIRIGSLVNYGYNDALLLAVPLQITPEFKPPVAGAGIGKDEVVVRLRATWLVCRVECIPEEGNFALSLPVRGSTAVHGAVFAQNDATQPLALKEGSTARIDGQRLHITVPGLPAELRGKTLALWPETASVLTHTIEPTPDWQQAWQGDIWTATVRLSPDRSTRPATLPLLITSAAQAWRSVATVQGEWTDTLAPAQVSPALAAALAANAPHPPALEAPALGSLWAALVGGLLGGLLLNLMPCVFPILALKVMGFARHGNQQRTQRLAGVAYTAGVVLSFLALGGLLLGLRAAGEQLGWGFQLQSPAVVALLAALFTLIGLNLAGLFEFGMFLPGRLATLQAQHPVGDAFLSGVLAVAIASPCTAPFMGASLGFAVGMPTAQALAVFAALGVGMALPYLAASMVPAVAGWLPRPGMWMETFRHAMAFPMFATVVWLVWVLGQQSGIDGAGALLALLVGLAACVWALTLHGRTRWIFATILIATNLWLAWAIGLNIIQTPETPTATGSASAGAWQPWSAQRVSELTAAGQPVFVDFTAAWCVTCQYNKRTTLADAGVQADFALHNVALLRADWTRRDPAITVALTALGRSGVPVYVLYAPQRAPVVMTEILNPAQIHSALDAL